VLTIVAAPAAGQGRETHLVRPVPERITTRRVAASQIQQIVIAREMFR